MNPRVAERINTWEKSTPYLFGDTFFIFWNSKIGKVGQNGPKNSFEKVILKCFFKKRQKIVFFHFGVFLCILSVPDDSSVRVSRFYKKVKNCFRGNGGSRWYFLQKKYVFYKMKCKNAGVFFKKQRKNTFFCNSQTWINLKQLNKKVTRKKRVFCCFFPTFFRFSLLHSILKVQLLVIFGCSDMTTSWILIQNLSETLKIEHKLGIFFKNQRFWTFFHTFCGIF